MNYGCPSRLSAGASRGGRGEKLTFYPDTAEVFPDLVEPLHGAGSVLEHPPAVAPRDCLAAMAGFGACHRRADLRKKLVRHWDPARILPWRGTMRLTTAHIAAGTGEGGKP